MHRMIAAAQMYEEETGFDIRSNDGERITHLEDIEVVTVTGLSGFEFAVKGGHNDESHNHNDVGSVILFYMGKPLLIDAGVGEYTAKTFGPDRYDIWTMQSSYHNLPDINGAAQIAGAEFRARDFAFQGDRSGVSISMDLTAAYPGDVGIVSLRREVALENGGKRFALRDAWRLETAESVVCNLLTACKPMIKASGQIAFEQHDCRMTISGYEVDATVERLILEDPKLTRSWGDEIFRIRLDVNEPPPEGELTLTFG